MSKGIPKTVKAAALDFRKHLRKHLPAKVKVGNAIVTRKAYPGGLLDGKRLGLDAWNIYIHVELGGLITQIHHPETFYV